MHFMDDRFVNLGEEISEARMLSREEQNHSKMPFFSHQEYCSRFREFVSLPLEQRRFCVDCQLLILPGESANHVKHRALSEDITVQRLKRPSLLLCPLDNKKSNAQYLFADWSCHFLLDMLLGSGFQKMLGHHGTASSTGRMSSAAIICSTINFFDNEVDFDNHLLYKHGKTGNFAVFVRAWRHCSSCGHCTLPDHPCGFNHGSQKHKLRACPKKYNKQ
ncbi:hypothetical protein cypCar_00001791 [Cyprinus carpio]|nr:hypothetical protein cypCar_00001791 [Cyprinus carpio]